MLIATQNMLHPTSFPQVFDFVVVGGGSFTFTSDFRDLALSPGLHLRFAGLSSMSSFDNSSVGRMDGGNHCNSEVKHGACR